MAKDTEVRKELEEISPALSRIPDTNPYSVPPGYFEQLPAAILAEVKQPRVLSMRSQPNRWRLAVAAVIAGSLVIGGWLLMEKRSSGDPLAQLDDSAVQKRMQQLSVPEMTAYADGNDRVSLAEIPPAPMTADDVPLVLTDVSDLELMQYLQQENPSAKLN